MTAKVFIDGDVGTTGLQIRARLEGRRDVTLLRLPENARKDKTARAERLNGADVSILCLPDDAAREAVSLIENSKARVIDASTAHRGLAEWVYGFPESDSGQPARIAAASRVSNPGCYAIATVALLKPLISDGLIPAGFPLTIQGVSGYSGGGKSLIESFENPASPTHTSDAFRLYALGLKHKHVPEIQTRLGLSERPLFVPSVGRYPQGMIVQVLLHLAALPGRPTAGDLHAALDTHYEGRRYVTVAPLADSLAMAELQPEALNGTNEMRLHVCANEAAGHAVLLALLDNLGKGASGQAVQNLNLMLGLSETAGLESQLEFA